MRFVNAIAATVTVVAGFAGSLTAAHALSIPNPLDTPMPQPIPGLSLPLPIPAGTDLQVMFRANEAAEPVVMNLTCEPTGGDHPRGAEACDSLAAAASGGNDPFAAPMPDQICTMIYGGPQTATVAGSFRGAAVDASFARTDGCQIARWNAIEPVLSPTPTG